MLREALVVMMFQPLSSSHHQCTDSNEIDKKSPQMMLATLTVFLYISVLEDDRPHSLSGSRADRHLPATVHVALLGHNWILDF